MRRQANFFVVDPQPIYRRGIMSCLAELPGVGTVTGADAPQDAWDHPALLEADVVLIDVGAPDAISAIARLSARDGCRVLATAVVWQQAELLEAVTAGARGVICKKELTEEALAAQIQAILHGAGVMPPKILSSLAQGTDSFGLVPHRFGRIAGLTSREQIVLKLIADGRLIREVAEELSYSERTVKSVLSTAVGKLGARSRSQAVAYAVREGLI